MEIRIHTVGKIVEGTKYKNWYVFVQTYSTSSYLVLISNNKHFGRDEEGKRIVDAQGYDSWMPDMPSLEYHFLKHDWVVEWLDERPSWLEDVAQ